MEKNMKKKIVIAAVLIAYLGLSAAVVSGVFEKKEEPPAVVVEEPKEIDPIDAALAERTFELVENTLEYAAPGQSGLYLETEDVLLLEEDKQNLLSRYQLPPLVRMDEKDAAEKMSNLQVLQRIETLGADVLSFYTPEYYWKKIYNDSITTVKDAISFDEHVTFSGTRASELNALLQTSTNVVIDIAAKELLLDETIRVPSNVSIEGNGVIVNGEANVPYAVLLENTQNAAVKGMRFLGGFEQGIYIIRSNKVLIYGNEITNAVHKALCVMDDNQYVNLVGNSIHENGNGSVFLNGEITNCIIQHNAVYQNRGTRNLTAGIVFSSMIVEEPYTPYNEFLDEYLYDLKKTPNHNVVMDNLIQGNYSSGFYSDGAYLNYVIDNVIEDNEKEGMCLDYGTFGTYVSGNTIQRNGERNRQTDEDLEADFILGAGRLPDGSSTAKLPGISIDNSAYNIVYNNNINENSGSGVKMVRSGYRNVILSNLITDNNAGQNEAYHGFGIELGHASTPDEPVKGLDFTADYENILARNIISGHHYSGIYIGEDCYCNDLIDNVILDCTQFSVENFSSYFNSAVGNNTNVGTLSFTLE